MKKDNRLRINLEKLFDDKNKAKELGLSSDYKHSFYMVSQEINGTNYIISLLRLNDDNWLAIDILKEDYGDFNEETNKFESKWVECSLSEFKTNISL